MRAIFPVLLLGLISVGQGVFPSTAHAQDTTLSGEVDLILPPSLASADAPFYRDARIKVGETVMPVEEAALPSGTLAEFQPENGRVVVSNSSTDSELAKGQALLDVVSALQASAIATAAGQ